MIFSYEGSLLATRGGIGRFVVAIRSQEDDTDIINAVLDARAAYYLAADLQRRTTADGENKIVISGGSCFCAMKQIPPWERSRA